MADLKHQKIQIDGKFRLESCEDALDIIQSLEKNIYEFNCVKINRADGHLFSKVFRDDKGDIVAGVGGWTWAGACEVTQLWVDEKLRRKGIGKILLNAAEEEAMNKGCVTILVRTYSFQAPGFYLEQGFKLEHVIRKFPGGYSYYALTKEIV
jgi:GNAT superfamily N-acetyltransferase